VPASPYEDPYRDSLEEAEVLTPRFHGVDQKFVAAVEVKHDDFEKAATSVEPRRN
jgi:hypothetical protein